VLITVVDLPNLEASGAQAIADRLAMIHGGRVLDVGTGEGEFIETLMKTLKSFDSVVGIDINQEDLAKGREAFPDQQVEFIEMDAEILDFADASFDTVCIANSLHHLAAAPRVLAEMKRVLKPGGHFIVEEMHQDGKQSEAQRTDILEHHWVAKIDRLQGIYHRETWTRNEIQAELKALKLSNLELLFASRYVKCLFCEQRADCENPKSEAIVDSFIKGIDKTLEGLEPAQRAPYLMAEANKLKLRVKDTGVANASIVFALGTK
jgi:ubiquinone/menaquinone biosynthesis C-methylase UbiE